MALIKPAKANKTAVKKAMLRVIKIFCTAIEVNNRDIKVTTMPMWFRLSIQLSFSAILKSY